MDRTTGPMSWMHWWWRWKRQDLMQGHVPPWEGVLRHRQGEGARRAVQAVSGERRRLGRLSESVEVLDFGAGHPHDGTPLHRSIAELAGTAGTDGRKAAWLHAVVADRLAAAGSGTQVHILEVGTSLGLGAMAMLHGQQERVRYIGLEGSPELARRAQERIGEQVGTVRVGPFDQTFPGVLSQHPGFDVVFLDGHHEGSILLAQWHLIRPALRPGACVVIDDIRWSRDMHAAWNRLADAPEIAALDVFRMGLVQRVDGTEAGMHRVPSRWLA